MQKQTVGDFIGRYLSDAPNCDAPNCDDSIPGNLYLFFKKRLILLSNILFINKMLSV